MTPPAMGRRFTGPLTSQKTRAPNQKCDQHDDRDDAEEELHALSGLPKASSRLVPVVALDRF
jgi:hypothetical protein